MMRGIFRGLALSIGLLATGTAQAQSTAGTTDLGPRGGGTRLAFEARADGLAVADSVAALGLQEETEPVPSGRGLLLGTAPTVAPGVRIMNGRLFLGGGIGWIDYRWTDCDNDRGCDFNENTTSTGGLSLQPMALYDVLQDVSSALYVGGWLTFAMLNGVTTESRDRAGSTTTIDEDGYVAWGLEAVVGIRADVTAGLAGGAELGWGFFTTTDAFDNSVFVHGLLASFVLEASVGI